MTAQSDTSNFPR